MKATLFIVMIMILVIPASAQDELPDPGITPDNVLYPVDVFFDNVGLAIAFGEEAKVSKAFEVAEERLAEANKMNQVNNTEAAQEALENHNAVMEHVRTRLNVTDNSTENLRLQLQIEERMRIHEKKIIYTALGFGDEDYDYMSEVFNQASLINDEVQEEKTNSMSKINNSDVVECNLKNELGINCNGPDGN